MCLPFATETEVNLIALVVVAAGGRRWTGGHGDGGIRSDSQDI